MKKILLLVFVLLFSMQIALACDMEEMDAGHGNEATGYSILGMPNLGAGYLLPIIFLYLIVGLGYVIYKINKIESKIKNRK